MEPPVCFAFKTARLGVMLMHHLTLRVASVLADADIELKVVVKRDWFFG